MRQFGLVLMVLALAPDIALADPASESDAADQKVEQMLESARQTYGISKPVIRCTQADPNEIVVCVDRGRDQSMPSTAESDPNSLQGRRFRDGNIPTAPQLDRGYCASCQHFGWVPPPVYYVDVSALPQAPEGSDADKIAKGEAPAP